MYFDLKYNHQYPTSTYPRGCIRLTFASVGDLVSFFSGDRTVVQNVQFFANTGNYVTSFQTFTNDFYKIYKSFYDGGCNNNALVDGESYFVKPSCIVGGYSVADEGLLRNLVLNHRFRGVLKFGGGYQTVYINFDCTFDNINSSLLYDSNDSSVWVCPSQGTDLDAQKQHVLNYGSSWWSINNFIDLQYGEDSSTDCIDVRSSSSTSEFLITLNGTDYSGNLESRHYNLLIQPDSTHTSGTITLGTSDELYSGFQEFTGASVRMLDNVCCHGTGYIDIYGSVIVNGLYWTVIDGQGLVDDIYIPHIASLQQNNVLLLRARFDDECCCDVTSFTDEVSDVLNNYFGSNELLNAAKSQIYFSVQPTSITWNGFERLSDFCCDDSECTSSSDYDYEINYPPISGGGGGDVDISCICDGLTSLNTMLASKLDSLVLGQGAIAEALGGIDFAFDNECICDNLESIDGTLGAIKTSIDNKELSVTNNNTVQPPVNNVTVQPPVNQVTVQSPVNNVSVEPPVNNVSVQPPVNNVTVQSPVNNISIPTTELVDIADNISSLSCICTNLESISDNLHDGLFNSDDESNLGNISKALNTSDEESESIADVIKNKDFGTNIDVEVSPADDVNINRVYYTNQRNGDTQI